MRRIILENKTNTIQQKLIYKNVEIYFLNYKEFNFALMSAMNEKNNSKVKKINVHHTYSVSYFI